MLGDVSYSYVLELANVVRDVKNIVIKNLQDHVNRFIESATRREAQVHVARSIYELHQILRRLVSKDDVVICSKSMVCEEAHVRKFLMSEVGCEVWETDVGEFILQVTGQVPSHITAPSIHIKRSEIAKALRERVGIDVSDDASPHEIVQVIRKFLRDKYVRATVGITGANALAADTGSVLIVENEGNARLVSALPRKHIVITGIEKVMPTLVHAFLTCLVQCFFAGVYPSAYINIITGRSNTTDVERIRVSPAQGPEEVHIILLDNGRSTAAEDPILWEGLRCIRCGRCLMHCPVYHVTGPGYGEPPYIGPMGIMWTAITRGVKYATKYAIMCLQCGNCSKVCPMRIDIRKIIAHIRKVA